MSGSAFHEDGAGVMHLGRTILDKVDGYRIFDGRQVAIHPPSSLTDPGFVDVHAITDFECH